jgi:hypothetical protein
LCFRIVVNVEKIYYNVKYQVIVRIVIKRKPQLTLECTAKSRFLIDYIINEILSTTQNRVPLECRFDPDHRYLRDEETRLFLFICKKRTIDLNISIISSVSYYDGRRFFMPVASIYITTKFSMCISYTH